MPKFEFIGGDPIDHFWLGHIEPGDVIEADGAPDDVSWKPTKKRPTEHGSDTPDPAEEG